MKNNRLTLGRFILMALSSLICAHLIFFLLAELIYNRIDSLAVLAFIPLLFSTAIVALFLFLYKWAKLNPKSIILGIGIYIGVLVVIELLLHPSLFTSDGSTFTTANLFVPTLMWDNDFEYLKIFPLTYGISIAFNYGVFILSLIISRKLLNDKSRP